MGSPFLLHQVLQMLYVVSRVFLWQRMYLLYVLDSCRPGTVNRNINGIYLGLVCGQSCEFAFQE